MHQQNFLLELSETGNKGKPLPSYDINPVKRNGPV